MDAQDRRRLIDMARRRVRPGTGSSLGILREGSAAYGPEILPPGLKGLSFVLVGGLATARYMPERMTLDTDLLIAREDLAQAECLLAEAGCERLGNLTIGGSTWRMPSGRSLDLIALERPWVAAALRTGISDETGSPCIALPYLVLMKLESGRLQDLADISRMLGGADDGLLETVRHEVRRYRPSDLEDLESMIHLGRLEYE